MVSGIIFVIVKKNNYVVFCYQLIHRYQRHHLLSGKLFYNQFTEVDF